MQHSHFPACREKDIPQWDHAIPFSICIFPCNIIFPNILFLKAVQTPELCSRGSGHLRNLYAISQQQPTRSTVCCTIPECLLRTCARARLVTRVARGTCKTPVTQDAAPAAADRESCRRNEKADIKEVLLAFCNCNSKF